MKLSVFAIYDGAVKAFNMPMFFRSTGEALRSFGAAVNEEGSQFNKFAGDYSMFHIGEFDDASGLIECLATPNRVVSAVECLVDKDDVFPPKKRLAM